MILLNYETVETEICDCMMASLVNTACYYGSEYEYLFKGVWVFDYHKKNDEETSFWKRLSIPGLVDAHEQLRLYHGINLITCDGDSYGSFVSKVKEELTLGNPVCIEFSAYHCPWAGVYHKYELKHFCLIVGYDETNRKFICSDPYVTEDLQDFSIDELEKGFTRYFIFRKETPEKSFKSWREDLLLGAESKFIETDGRNIFQKLKDFAEEIKNPDNFIDEMRKQNSEYSYELFYQMKYISHSRLNYGQFIKYIAEKTGVTELNKCVELLIKSSKEWRIIWLKFTKVAYMMNEVKIQKLLDNVFERINYIIDLETETAERIISICKVR
ncbi:C39 family peptidase [Clostridium sp. D2Q-14]|uniref:C39 family peptidase n=1 Tax=Anaeromonas gelatinilytica TaxID=2683194 RepID=UPI00193BDEA6|nr:C39 family peptidase [Anaeromonas gelatinilytica]MBS4536701.1 C39 family peptidase [Anaeromonas gelatinilytica]